jgi:hypothetical protein
MEIVLIGQAEVDAALREYPKKATRALVRAMNRALTSGRTLMVQRIAADTGLRSGDIKKAFTQRDARAESLEARIGVGLKRIPLISFNARGQEPSRGKGRGVSYRLKGGSGRIANAFIATMRSGHRGVFVRVGNAARRGPAPNRSQLPIRELFGPSLGHVFAKYRPEGVARVREAFAKNFASEMSFEKSRAGTR